MMPTIQAAFVCKSFTQETGGFLSFNSVVQSVRAQSVPGRFDQLALGIYVTDLPADRDSSLQTSLMGTDTFIELDGQLKANIPLKRSEDGFAQIAYKLRDVVVPQFDAYRFVFYFDGSPEVVHYAPFVVLPLSPTHNKDLPSWVRPKTTRH